jgi:hypothetical protein
MKHPKHHMTHIAYKNESTVVTDDEAFKAVAAWQIQVSRDFAPHWGIDAKLLLIERKDKYPKGMWQIPILDNADQAGALGYHDISAEGLPTGKIFAKTAKGYGSIWTVTGSHETLEPLSDPDINLTVFREDIRELWAYENADACQDDSFAYEINGVKVSDFVFPEWFEGFWGTDGTQFDFQKIIRNPFELLSGGYIGYYSIDERNGWQQRMAQGIPSRYQTRPPVGSRRERRRTPRKDWVRSSQ